MKISTKRFIRITAAGIFLFFLFTAARSADRFGWIPWLEQEICVESVSTLDRLVLDEKAVKAYEGEQVIWTSPVKFRVQQMLWCDIDRDGARELVLLCWKLGRFGKARPFWIERDEHLWSQHIYVYDWDEQEKRMDPVWMASDIGIDVLEMSYDTSQEYLQIHEKNGTLSFWGWLSWGLERIDTSVTLLAAGDNLLHMPIVRMGLEKGSFDFLYNHISKRIREYDIAVLNQETPLVSEPSLYGGFPSFGTPAEAAAAIRHAGFDVVTCGTNHAFDRRMTGIDTTVSTFESLGLTTLGIQASWQEAYQPFQIYSCKGARLALLNYTAGLNGQKLPEEYPCAVHTLKSAEQVMQDIRRAKEQADLTIVFVHWGTEYAAEVDEEQRRWTQLFLENEVDVVIGTHPHVVQPCELLTSTDGHRMLVYYSLGNFMSAQEQPECVAGELAEITFQRREDGYTIESYRTEKVITHQESKWYTVFLEEEYPDVLAKRHRLKEIP